MIFAEMVYKKHYSEFHAEVLAVVDRHTRPALVGDNVTVAAYALDMASVVHLLDALPNLRAYMDRMYARPKAPQRIAQAFASLCR
jgi:glutathione S-transferase